MGSVLVALMFGLHERVSLERLADGRTLLPAAAAMCAGLGLACTAVLGLRRYVLPPALAIGFAVLANGNARPWKEASERLEQLKEDVLYARKAFGPQTPLLVIDAPRDVLGLDPLGQALPNLLHPLFSAKEARLSETAVDLDARDLPRAGLELLLGQPDLPAIIQSSTQVGMPLAGTDEERAAHTFRPFDDVLDELTVSEAPEAPIQFGAMTPYRGLRSPGDGGREFHSLRLELLDLESFAYGMFFASGRGSIEFWGSDRFLRRLLEPPVDPRRSAPEPDLRFQLEDQTGAPSGPLVFRGTLEPAVYQALR